MVSRRLWAVPLVAAIGAVPPFDPARSLKLPLP
jgi:hypothetical protein